MLEVARAMARAARHAVKPLMGRSEAREPVVVAGRATKRIDSAAEGAALGVLESTRIPAVATTEEAGRVSYGERPEYICVLDPLDGTYNALHGIPLFSISIAFAEYRTEATPGDVRWGYVENLATGETFEGTRGAGASRDGRSMNTSTEERLEDSTFGIYLQRSDVAVVRGLVKRAKRIRALGSAALELCYVASGAYEGFMDLRGAMRVTDIAAGKLICEEAGGAVTRGDGRMLDVGILENARVPILATANRGLQGAVLQTLQVVQ